MARRFYCYLDADKISFYGLINFLKKMKMNASKKKLINVRCNICGADDYNVYIKSNPLKLQDNGRQFSTTSNYVGTETIVKCKSCGLVYVNPRIGREEIVDGYAKADESTYVKESKARSATFKRCMDEIERYHPKSGRILDIGCAAGLFLEVAKKRGWEVFGVEPNRWLAEWGGKNLGIKISSKPFEEVGFKENFFDVVTLWDVLEHLADPKKALLESAKILKKDGYLVVNYPDIGSWLARLFGRKWWFILSVHLYYFTPTTIRRILEESGFEVVRIKPHFQKLSFGYLIYRMKAYSNMLYAVLAGFSRMFGLDGLEIPYYAAQTMVIARKR